MVSQQSFSIAAVRIRRWLAVAVVATTTLAGAATVHWGYHGSIGPEHWGDLDSSFALCKTGLAQSPINIITSATVESEGPGLEFDYSRSTTLDLVHNGHTVQANVPAFDGKLKIGKKDYVLLQFHYHTESEHTINGNFAPVEIHFVHRTAAGELAVVGVMVEGGRPNREAAKLFPLPGHEGEHRTVAGFDLNRLLPLDDDFEVYRYNGSLTTPGCGEGVLWNVLGTPVRMSNDQILAFVDLFDDHTEFPHGNRRPVQPLNGRRVLAIEQD